VPVDSVDYASEEGGYEYTTGLLSMGVARDGLSKTETLHVECLVVPVLNEITS
jgi:hypothetical protein